MMSEPSGWTPNATLSSVTGRPPTVHETLGAGLPAVSHSICVGGERREENERGQGINIYLCFIV